MKWCTNGPEGTLFPLDSLGLLGDDHTFLVSLAVVPKMRVLHTSSRVLYEDYPSEQGERSRVKILTPSMVGVNGGPEAVKKAVCDLIDRLWEQRC